MDGVSVRPLSRPGGIVAPEAARELLRTRIERALRVARRHGQGLAGLTLRLAPETDPTALVLASRRAGEPSFCYEQPDRDGSALAALGCVAARRSARPRRPP